MPPTIKQNRPSIFGPDCRLYTRLSDIAGIGDEGWVITGSPVVVETPYGRGMQFDLTNPDYVNVFSPAIAVASLTTYTIFGVYSITDGNDGTIYGEGNSGNNTPLISIRMNAGGDGILLFFHRDDANVSALLTYGAEDLSDGDYHTYAAVRRAANSWELYSDGVSRDTDATNLGATTVDQQTIGVTLRIAAGQPYTGIVDTTLLFGRAFSDADVLGLHNQIRGAA